MSREENRRARTVTRQIHRLFWRANWVDKTDLIIGLGTRIPAMIIYNILIPLQIAFGLQAIITRHFDDVRHYVVMIILLSILYCVLWAVGGVAICRNGVVSAEYVQRAIFSNFLHKDYDFYNDSQVGALGAQATKVRDAINEYNQLLMLNVPKQIVIVVAGLAVIAYNSLVLAAVTLACMALVLGFTILSSKWRLKYRRLLSEKSSELAGVIGDALSQSATVKSFASEHYEEQRLSKTLPDWMSVQFKSWVTSVPADTGRAFLNGVTIAILLIMTSRLYQQHKISIAVVALVQLYVIRLVTSTLEIAEIIKSYEAIIGGSYQSMVTMLVEPEVTDISSPRRLAKNKNLTIEFRSVTYKYGESARSAAVNTFDLKINHGEKVGLVGYSGSGKTTLTKLLLRFMDTSAGSIVINDIDIKDIAQSELRSCIAYVPQEPLLFHRSIAENIAYGRPSAGQKDVKEVAHMAYVDEFVKDLSNGYDTIVGERGVKLSGGQRQRVAIARALLKQAPILVLDEATSSLDSQSERYIQKALETLMQGRTALIIAHRLSTIQHMDRIVVMDRGRIVQIGTHSELLKNPEGIYAQLWAHQSGGYLGGQPSDSGKN